MVTITLPPELEMVVTQRANKQGTTPERIALDGLCEKFLPDSGPVATVNLLDEEESVRAKFDAVYGGVTSRLDPLFREIQLRSLPEDKW